LDVKGARSCPGALPETGRAQSRRNFRFSMTAEPEIISPASPPAWDPRNQRRRGPATPAARTNFRVEESWGQGYSIFRPAASTASR
jgi:hypothetical protein